jgi:DNA-binding FrmR family transcriptional regulator
VLIAIKKDVSFGFPFQVYKSYREVSLMSSSNTHMKKNAHKHPHPHEPSHTHTHTQTRAVINRLSRASGHLESVKRMVQDGRDCSEVLTQLAAVISALNSAARIILKDHLAHCLVDAVESDDLSAIDNLNKAIDQFMK